MLPLRDYRFNLNTHAVPQWLYPLSTQYTKYHHERMEEISEIPSEISNLSLLLVFHKIGNRKVARPGYGVRIEVILSVVLPKQLHAQHGEDVDDYEEYEGQVPQGTQGGDDDAQENLHRGPRLRQLQNSHLEQEILLNRRWEERSDPRKLAKTVHKRPSLIFEN